MLWENGCPMVTSFIIHKGPNVARYFSAWCGVGPKSSICGCLMFSKMVLVRRVLFNIIEGFVIIFKEMLAGFELIPILRDPSLVVFAIIQRCLVEDVCLECHDISMKMYPMIQDLNSKQELRCLQSSGGTRIIS